MDLLAAPRPRRATTPLAALAAGPHTLEWRGGTAAGAAADGVHFVRLKTADATETRRITWLR